jgi:hypothetical protein
MFLLYLFKRCKANASKNNEFFVESSENTSTSTAFKSTWQIVSFAGLGIRIMFEALIFSCATFYFIATVCDLFLYPNGLPVHLIILFSPLAFKIAIIPSILIFLGCCVKKSTSDYTINLSKKRQNTCASLLNLMKNTLDNQKQLTCVEKISAFISCVRVIFETSGAAFWFIFLYDHNEAFFIGERLIILLVSCIAFGIIKSIASCFTYIDTIKKYKNKFCGKPTSAKQNKSNRSIAVIVIASSLLTVTGCLCIQSELKEVLPFLNNMSPINFWFIMLITLLSVVCAEAYCNYANFVIESGDGDMDGSRIYDRQLPLKTNVAHVALSLFHSLAYFLQAMFPVCFSVESYLITNQYLSKHDSRLFWICMLIPIVILVGFILRNDLSSLREYELRNTQPSHSIHAKVMSYMPQLL